MWLRGRMMGFDETELHSMSVAEYLRWLCAYNWLHGAGRDGGGGDGSGRREATQADIDMMLG